ncbi:MAG: gluconeogenesis factor YvcK family protein [Bacillota bacterium]
MLAKSERGLWAVNDAAIVALGGGSGLPVLLRGLKGYTSRITAVVTVCDDGGSSGRLRRDMGIVAPGDVRNCIIALADTEPLMEELFAYRFDRGELKGHSLGNLILAALTQIRGDFREAVAELSQVLKVRGKVLPSTLKSTTLCARLKDGTVVRGETAVGASSAIDQVFLDPPAEGLPEVTEAILGADLVVLGPGSLYTSVIPNLVVKDVAEAIRESKAVKVFVCNIMTEPGETLGYTALDHVKAILKHCGDVLDCVVVNSEQLPEEVRTKYAAEGAVPVEVEVRALEEVGMKVWAGPLLDVSGGVARHQADALARAILELLG